MLKNTPLKTTKCTCPSITTIGNDEEEDREKNISEKEDTNILSLNPAQSDLHQSQHEQKKVLEHALTQLGYSLKKDKIQIQEKANIIIRELYSDVKKTKEILEKQKQKKS